MGPALWAPSEESAFDRCGEAATATEQTCTWTDSSLVHLIRILSLVLRGSGCEWEGGASEGGIGDHFVHLLNGPEDGCGLHPGNGLMPFFIASREWQMERAFQTALWLLQPEVVFILGDIFDEGKWSSPQVGPFSPGALILLSRPV